MLTTVEVAKILGFHRITVGDLAIKGILKGKKVGKMWIFSPDAVEQFALLAGMNEPFECDPDPELQALIKMRRAGRQDPLVKLLFERLEEAGGYTSKMILPTEQELSEINENRDK